VSATPPLDPAFEQVLAALRHQLGAQLVHELALPREPARYAAPVPPLAPEIERALAACGVGRLYEHQERALAASRARRDVLVTTATASGKSLVFQLPVLEEALAGGSGRALWIFPLKALGQDQRAKLEELAAAAGLSDGRCRVAIYDGDTPDEARAAIRRAPPRVLITNPDMLHLGILANPGAWSPFLADLSWIVLDELHAYRGIFGCHLHHVLARLLRPARPLGARPAIVAASATAAEADVFAAAIAGRPFEWVRDSGAPREARSFLLVRPLASPYTAALEVLEALLERGQKTIVFTKARRITELLFTWLERRSPELARRVRCYRAGFLPSERRRIESDLSSGRLDGVISTSALELGIDIGGLDACVLVGWPGSVMATWQRSGRVGRRGRRSLTVLVALPDALDQYLLDHPRELLERPCERLVVDPANEVVARAHLVCAAAERALALDEDAPWLERHAALVGDLLREGGLVRSDDGRRIVSLVRRPHREVSLRGTGASAAIVDGESGATIGTIDGARALAECHPGAIYLHAGRQYAVTGLDLARREVRVSAADVDYFTSPLSEKETEILEVFAERASGALAAGFGRLKVTERVVGFERKRTHGLEVIDRQSLDLPPVAYETQGLWLRAPAAAAEALEAAGGRLLGALHAVEHAAIGLFPLVALCDRSDLGGISLSFHPQLEGAGLFVYEGHAGGVGICRKGFEELPELLGRVRDHLARCPCDDGCPSCIQSPKCGNGNRPLDKAGALRLLEHLLGAGEVEEILAIWRAQARPAPPVPLLAELFAEPSATELAAREPGLAPLGAVRGGRGALPEKGRGGTRSRRSSPPRRMSVVEAPEPATSVPTVTPFNGAVGSSVSSTSVFREQGAALPRGPAGGGGTVLFDVETLRSAEDVGGWHRAHRMGIAVAVALRLEEGRFETFFEAEVPRLVELLKSANLVVGFNSRRFDYAVLSGYTGEDYRLTLPSLDLLESLHGVLGFRVKLDHLAQETLGRGKSADGLQSLEWVKQGRLDLVEAYCRQDVEVMRDVYLFGRREGYVLIADRVGGRVRVPVDW
jgi:DEAD/DEAH box helicase domain-containing protein